MFIIYLYVCDYVVCLYKFMFWQLYLKFIVFLIVDIVFCVQIFKKVLVWLNVDMYKYIFIFCDSIV